MYAGEKINTTEGRAVLHVALRAARSAEIVVDGVNQVPLVHEVLDHIKDFSARVLSTKFVGATGKPLKNVISIGIGGSYLGPEFVYEAIKCGTCPNRSCLRLLSTTKCASPHPPPPMRQARGNLTNL